MRSQAPVLLTDADKFGRRLTYGVARLGAGAHVVTDARLGTIPRGLMTELGIGLTLAGAG